MPATKLEMMHTAMERACLAAGTNALNRQQVRLECLRTAAEIIPDPVVRNVAAAALALEYYVWTGNVAPLGVAGTLSEYDEAMAAERSAANQRAGKLRLAAARKRRAKAAAAPQPDENLSKRRGAKR